MRHPTNTRVIFADSPEAARNDYLALSIETKDPKPALECFKVLDLEDFDIDSDINFVEEISVGPPVMEVIRIDPPRAYVLYYMEEVS